MKLFFSQSCTETRLGLGLNGQSERRDYSGEIMAGRKNIPAVISAMGILLDIVVALVAALKRRGTNVGEAFYHLGTAEGKVVIEEMTEKITDFLGKLGSMVTAPEGGRIHIVRNVLVDESREWREAVTALPQTSAKSDVWKVGDSSPPTAGAKVVKKDIILSNFGRGSVTPSEKALDWGKAHGLRPITPRELFAVANHKPNLHSGLGLPAMVVVSLVVCYLAGESRVCYSWWGGAEREAGLDWFTSGWYG